MPSHREKEMIHESPSKSEDDNLLKILEWRASVRIPPYTTDFVLCDYENEVLEESDEDDVSSIGSETEEQRKPKSTVVTLSMKLQHTPQGKIFLKNLIILLLHQLLFLCSWEIVRAM